MTKRLNTSAGSPVARNRSVLTAAPPWLQDDRFIETRADIDREVVSGRPMTARGQRRCDSAWQRNRRIGLNTDDS